MSEISKIQKGLELIQNKYEIILIEDKINQIKINELLEIIHQLKNFRTIFDKIISKLDEKDPITQTPRYGPNMKLKIQKLDLDLNLNLQQYEVLFQDKLNLFNQQNEELKKSLLLLSSSSSLTQNEHENENKNEKLFEGNNINNNNVNNDDNNNNHDHDQSLNDSLLNERAEIIRKKKRIQAHLERYQQYQELQLLILAVNYLNEIYSTNVSNFSYVDKAINDLINNNQNNNENNNIKKQVVKFIIEILESISRRPDDEKLRRIRINHPAIMKRINLYLWNFICLLLSVGFSAKLVLSDGSILSPELLLPPPNIDEEELSEIQTSIFNSSINYDSFNKEGLNNIVQQFITSPTQTQSQYTLLLEMIEPSIDLNPSEVWIRWFDSLKENIDRLQTYNL